jgi:hypothetical protein
VHTFAHLVTLRVQVAPMDYVAQGRRLLQLIQGVSK